jgi:hypothetical protein
MPKKKEIRKTNKKLSTEIILEINKIDNISDEEIKKLLTLYFD